VKIETKVEKLISNSFIESDFEIPDMPFGWWIEIHIYDTWGDPHYLGMSGIEIFNNEGEFIKI